MDNSLDLEEVKSIVNFIKKQSKLLLSSYSYINSFKYSVFKKEDNYVIYLYTEINDKLQIVEVKSITDVLKYSYKLVRYVTLLPEDLRNVQWMNDFINYKEVKI